MIAAVAALVVGLLAVGAALALHSGTKRSAGTAGATTVPPVQPSPGSTPTTLPPSATTAPAGPPGAEAIATVAASITQSATVRTTIGQAITGVQRCSITPSRGMAALAQAVATRQQAIATLQATSVAGLPGGAQLVGALTKALSDSITADQDYAAWMQDVQTTNAACSADPTQDSNYAAGQAASAQATADKSAFVTLWNALAPTYSQQPLTAGDL